METNFNASPRDPPHDVLAIRRQIRAFLRTDDGTGQRIGSRQWGVYAFFDYDGEPIYVGQTRESIGSRISRHLTNQRTDAVAMNVLDPFEVAEVEVWIFDLAGDAAAQVRFLDRAEYTVFQRVLAASAIGAVLNEKELFPTDEVELPQSFKGSIIPAELYDKRKHADVRIARRASTIAALARVISERDVSKGLRRTLLTQARRLERLAAQRLTEFGAEAVGEATGETDA